MTSIFVGLACRLMTRHEDYIVSASLAEYSLGLYPASGLFSCILFTSASKDLATSNISGCHLNCCIVWCCWIMLAKWSRISPGCFHTHAYIVLESAAEFLLHNHEPHYCPKSVPATCTIMNSPVYQVKGTSSQAGWAGRNIRSVCPHSQGSGTRTCAECRDRV